MTFQVKSQSSGAFPGGMGTPTFVQGTGSDLNDNNGIDGNGYKFNLPNLTFAGNCLVLAIAYPFKSGRTITISDSNGDTWPAAAVTAGTASLGNINTSIFVLPNATAGLHKLTVTFDAAIRVFQYTYAEFYNIAIASPADGTHSAASVAGTSAAAGSFTPSTNNDANGGHLIFAYAISNDTVGTNASNQASAISKSGGVSPSFMCANNFATIPSASSFDVQTANGAINPGFNFTQSSGTNFVVAAVALKASNAGQMPAAGIRVKRILHYTISIPQTGNNVFLFPCDGNLLVGTIASGNDLNVINSVTDSNSQTYTNPGAASEPQIFYKQNATPSNAMTITFNLNASETQCSLRLFDIVGAQTSSFQNASGIYTTSPSSGSVANDLPDHTPSSAPGLTIAVTGFGTGPMNGIAAGAPAGAIYDIVYYTGMTDQDRMDNADGIAHVYYSTTAAQTWNWGIDAGARGSTAFATAVSFK